MHAYIPIGANQHTEVPENPHGQLIPFPPFSKSWLASKHLQAIKMQRPDLLQCVCIQEWPTYLMFFDCCLLYPLDEKGLSHWLIQISKMIPRMEKSQLDRTTDDALFGDPERDVGDIGRQVGEPSLKESQWNLDFDLTGRHNPRTEGALTLHAYRSKIQQTFPWTGPNCAVVKSSGSLKLDLPSVVIYLAHNLNVKLHKSYPGAWYTNMGPLKKVRVPR